MLCLKSFLFLGLLAGKATLFQAENSTEPRRYV